MNKPVLVIMAAGMGSRYGGLKQIDPVDEYGNLIIDFSIYDAQKAGFEKIIFIIKKEMEQDFREIIGDRISRFVETDYVYQETTAHIGGFTIPEGRTKPWGTAHAILCCRDKVNGPFAVINADDYYGSQAFSMIYEELLTSSNTSQMQYAMVGYLLENTLTEHGYVSRGVCQLKNDCWLKEVTEYTKITKNHDFAGDTVVSMNLWGFKPSLFPEIETQFTHFLADELSGAPLKSEFFLPTVVSKLLKEQKACVKVRKTKDRWYGVTYKEDKPMVMAAIKKLKEEGIYPEQLWEDRDEDK